MIYLLTAIGLSPGGSITVHIYTQTIHRTTQIKANWEECGPCPVFANFTLAVTLQLRKKHWKISIRVRKTSVRVRKTSVRVQYIYYQNTHTLQNLYTYTHTHTHTHMWRNLNAFVHISSETRYIFVGSKKYFEKTKTKQKFSVSWTFRIYCIF